MQGRHRNNQPPRIGEWHVEGKCPTCDSTVWTEEHWHENREFNAPEHDECTARWN